MLRTSFSHRSFHLMNLHCRTCRLVPNEACSGDWLLNGSFISNPVNHRLCGLVPDGGMFGSLEIAGASSLFLYIAGGANLSLMRTGLGLYSSLVFRARLVGVIFMSIPMHKKCVKLSLIKICSGLQPLLSFKSLHLEEPLLIIFDHWKIGENLHSMFEYRVSSWLVNVCSGLLPSLEIGFWLSEKYCLSFSSLQGVWCPILHPAVQFNLGCGWGYV